MSLDQVDAYVLARRIARAEIGKRDLPPSIERDVVRVLAPALLKYGSEERLGHGAIERIVLEVAKKYINGEILRAGRGAA